MTEQAVRATIVQHALWGVQHEPQIHYTMGAQRDDWLQAGKRPPVLPLSTDCSGFVTLCYWWAGAQDPNGLGYRYLGYTGTLLAYCRHILPKQARVGDLIVYGPGTGHHVTIIVGAAQDGSLEVVSHGSEAGPVRILNYEVAAFQPRPITFLRSPQFA